MIRPLIRKYVRESKTLLACCTLVMFAFCWLRVWIVGLFPMDRFQTIAEQFREMERFAPVPFEQLFTYSGRVALTYDMLIVVMSMSLWAIARGSDCISGELGRGTLEMLLAQPVSRLKILLTHATVTLGGTAILALASWLGIYMCIQTTAVPESVVPAFWTPSLSGLAIASPLMDVPTRLVPLATRLDAAVFWPAAINLFALGFFLTAFSTLVSSADRFRWRTIGIVAGVFVIQLIAKIAGLASVRIKWLLKTTFFSAYDPEHFVSVAVHTPEHTWALVLSDPRTQTLGLGPAGSDLTLIGLGLIAYLGAAVIFLRRDLPAPV